MRIPSTLISGAVAAVVMAGSASASVTPVVVYDSTSMYAAGSAYPGTGGGTVAHYTQAYWANQLIEVGGKIGLAGSARQAHSATVQMRTGGAASGAQAGNVTMSMNLYSLNSDGSVGTLFMTKTQTFATPASTGPSSNGWQWRPYFDVTFDLSGLGTLPEQFAYGVAFNGNQNTVANSLNISLWNYGADPGGYVFGGNNYWYGDATYPRTVDGPQVKTGTDLMTGTWGRWYDGGSGYTGNLWSGDMYYGLTPNVSFSTVPAPGAAALIGLAGVFGARRRKA